MHWNQDLKWVKGTVSDRRSTGTLSGVIRMGDYKRCLLVADKQAFATKSSKIVLRARCATTSGMTYASAANVTPFTLINSGATNSTSDAFAFNIDIAGGGPFVRYLLSTVTASASCGVFGQLSEGTVVPPSTTGFSSITFQPTSP